MLGWLRLVARALSGKLEAAEFSLGIFFGIALGLLPAREVQDGTGFLGLNALWLAVLFLFLLLRASIPVGLLFLGAAQAAGVLFLDRCAWEVGRFVLDGLLPERAVRASYEAWPALQLHTYWGLGGALLAPAAAVLCALLAHRILQRRLKAWQERFARTLVVRGLNHSLAFRALSWWAE